MEFKRDIDFLATYWQEAQAIKLDIETRLGDNGGNLEPLARKLSDMIDRGRAKDIKPFVERIVYSGVKKHTQPHWQDGEFLGHVHYRWDWKGHTLTDDEIETLKEYFELN